MKIVQPSVELLSITPDAERMIERAGRTCYKSESKITSDSAAGFVQMLIKRGHLAMIEHASATMKFIGDRGMSHELVRHRLCSFAQESTRYCNYGKDEEISVIEPLGLSDSERSAWKHSCEVAEQSYLWLVSKDAHHPLPACLPQVARSVLPICLKTEIVTTANLREWRHIFKLRTSEKAHPQIRHIMIMALKILKEQCPNVFADFDIIPTTVEGSLEKVMAPDGGPW